MWWLESDHRGRGHRTQMLQAQPSEERNGETLLGCLGRTALRREQCETPFSSFGNNTYGEISITSTLCGHFMQHAQTIQKYEKS
jgi:hypothetical protein